MFNTENMTRDNKNEINNNTAISYEARIKAVQVLAEETRKLLEEYRNRRELICQELKESLAKHESLRKSDFDKMMADILAVQLERAENVRTMLANYEEQEMEVVKNLREMLKKGENLRLEDFRKTMSRIRKEQNIGKQKKPRQFDEDVVNIQLEIRRMLEDLKKEKEKITSGWQNLAAMTEKIVIEPLTSFHPKRPE